MTEWLIQQAKEFSGLTEVSECLEEDVFDGSEWLEFLMDRAIRDDIKIQIKNCKNTQDVPSNCDITHKVVIPLPECDEFDYYGLGFVR